MKNITYIMIRNSGNDFRDNQVKQLVEVIFMSWVDELSKREKEKQQRAEKVGNLRIYKPNVIAVPLSPMVKGVLVELGKALWGRGLLGYKYHLYDEADMFGRWEISSKSRDNLYRHKIEVRINLNDMKGFQVYCSIIEDGDLGSFKSYETSDFSEDSLKNALLNLCESLSWYPNN